MTPAKVQYFFARDWPAKLWFAVVPLAITLVVGSLEPNAAWLNSHPALHWLFAALFGCLVALVAGWVVLGAMYHDRLRKNGGPFNVGDMVQILAGPHRGRIARVYSLWQGDTVRVDLGEEEKTKIRDVFCGTKLLKISRAEVPEHPCLL